MSTKTEQYKQGVVDAINFAMVQNRFIDADPIARALVGSGGIVSVDVFQLKYTMENTTTPIEVPENAPDVWYFVKSDYDQFTYCSGERSEVGIARVILKRIVDELEQFESDSSEVETRYRFAKNVC